MQDKEKRMLEKNVVQDVVARKFYQVPDVYIGRRVWTLLKGDTLRIESGKEVIARYRVKTDYLKD